MRQLLKNCDILATENGVFVPLHNAYLGISNDTIDYIGTEKPEAVYDSEKDMSGKMLLPGLINCHGHAPMVLLRGVGSDLPLQEWLFDKMMPIEDKMGEAELKAGMELAQLEMLACGTTSYSEMYMMPWVEAEVVERSGMKANLTRVVQCFDPSQTYEQNTQAKQSVEFFEKYHNTVNGRVLVDFSIHAEYTNYPHIMEAYAKDCLSHGARMQVHMSETRREHEECIAKYGKTPAELFESLGVFDSPTSAAHCVWVSEHDMDIMAAKGVSVIHNPESNMKLGSGFAPVMKMIDKGINVTIGTDGAASNNNLNMFEEMHLASVIHNGYLNDPTILKPVDVLKMATVNGAKLQGRGDTGALTVGLKADIIAVDMTKPHMQPCIDPMALITYSAQGSDVCMTMVDGKILYENGEYLTLDRERIYHDVKTVLKNLY